jgi:hypothetical protein
MTAKSKSVLNLEDNPKPEQLAQLLAECDDNAGHHIIWVDYEGNVFIDMVPNNLTPAGWAEQNWGLYKFRFETAQKGNGYVGKEAAKDKEYVKNELESLIEHWKSGETGYIDY